MSETVRRKLPNYLSKLQRLLEDGQIGAGVYQIEVAHDRWCAIYLGGPCDCNPDVRVKEGNCNEKTR